MTTFLTCVGEELFLTEDLAAVAAPACGCMETVSKFIYESHRARLGSWRMPGGVNAPTIYDLTGRLPPVVVPQFCPFCGNRYGSPAAAMLGDQQCNDSGIAMADRVARLEARVATLERDLADISRTAAA